MRNGSHLILCFHRISETPFRQLVSHFLKTRASVSVSSEFDASTSRLTVTFDDGVAGAVELGARVAEELGFHVVFYLPTDFLDGKGLWPAALAALTQSVPPGAYRVLGSEFRLPGYREQYRLRDTIVRRLRDEPSRSPEPLLDEVRRVLDPQSRVDLSASIPSPVGWDRVAELAEHPLITFGSHTVTHRPLSALTEAEIEWECAESRRRIESVTGRACEHFCYPFGQDLHIGALAQRVAARHFRTAVTLKRGRVTRMSNSYMLPRLDLYDGDRPMRARVKLWAAELGIG